MRRTIAVLAFLAACNHRPGPTTPSDDDPNIRQLEVDGVLACTTFRVAGVWVTAHHCTEDASGIPYFLRIGGVPVERVVRRGEDGNDVALLVVPVAADPLPVARELPEFRMGPDAEVICFAGFPQYGGMTHPGTWCGMYNGVDGDGDIRLGTMVDGGASGSPLFNADGEVIGVVVASHRRTLYSYAEPFLATW